MRLPDVEAMIIPFIRSHVGSVKVGTKVPNPRPATYVRAWVNGGAAINRVLERVQVTVHVWAPTQPGASTLAQDIRHAFLNDTASLPLVRGVEEVTRPYFNPDDGMDRYTATYALMVRARRV